MERSALEPLQVFALNADMERASGPIPYTSLVWTRRYYGVGEFQMVVPRSVYDPSWAYICCDERPETGIVQKPEFRDTDYSSDMSLGADEVMISGFFLEALLNNVVNLVEEVEEQKEYVPKPSWPTSAVSARGAAKLTSLGDIAYRDGGTWRTADGYEVDPSIILGDVAVQNSVFGWGGDDYSRYYYSTTGAPHIGGRIEGTHMALRDLHMGGTIEYVDSGGTVYYRDDETNTLRAAQGVAVNNPGAESYYRNLAAWERLESDETGHYRMIEVAGPWSRQDMDVLTGEHDNVQLVYAVARKLMQDNILYDVPDFEGVPKTLPDTNASLTYLGDWMFQELATVGASCRLFYSFEHNTTVLQFWRGRDRTQSQSDNPWAVFSEEWGTLYGFSASYDTSNYKNKCYVLYDYDEPTAWSGQKPSAKPLYEWNDTGVSATLKGYRIPYARRRGTVVARLDDGRPDAETWLDLRGEAPAADGQWSRSDYSAEPTDLPACKDQYTGFLDGLKERGLSYLRDEHGVVIDLDTGTLSQSDYLTGWDLGDKVDMAVTSLGLSMEARITEVVETYDKDGGTVRFDVTEREIGAIQ